MKKILVIGSLNMDVVLHVPVMPQKGETISGSDLSYVPGGKGANQAYAAAKLGASVSVIGAVGDDAAGKALVANLQEAGADISGIEVCRNTPTGQAFITVDGEGNNSIVLIAGANELVTRELMDRHLDLFREADILLLQMEIPLKTVIYAKEMAVKLGKTVLVDPAPAVKGLPDSFWKGIDFLKPNETETGILTGKGCRTMEELDQGAEMLQQLGVKNVLISLGEKGCFWSGREEKKIYPAQKVRAIDTTAAGDCFMGAFARKLSEDAAIEESVLFAQKAAAVSVTRKGAQTSMPSMDELLSE